MLLALFPNIMNMIISHQFPLLLSDPLACLNLPNYICLPVDFPVFILFSFSQFSSQQLEQYLKNLNLSTSLPCLYPSNDFLMERKFRLLIVFFETLYDLSTASSPASALTTHSFSLFSSHSDFPLSLGTPRSPLSHSLCTCCSYCLDFSLLDLSWLVLLHHSNLR